MFFFKKAGKISIIGIGVYLILIASNLLLINNFFAEPYVKK
jgi:hypothetical protein